MSRRYEQPSPRYFINRQINGAYRAIADLSDAAANAGGISNLTLEQVIPAYCSCGEDYDGTVLTASVGYLAAKAVEDYGSYESITQRFRVLHGGKDPGVRTKWLEFTRKGAELLLKWEPLRTKLVNEALTFEVKDEPDYFMSLDEDPDDLYEGWSEQMHNVSRLGDIAAAFHLLLGYCEERTAVRGPAINCAVKYVREGRRLLSKRQRSWLVSGCEAMTQTVLLRGDLDRKLVNPAVMFNDAILKEWK